ncbi:CoA-binding protein [Enterococcus faecium]|uniref:CoA-binding protein n=1 Tax=Enterococcus faecium TaxID=1352 RepID=UPI000CF260E0|nr:CoA-binding protein [Enterococcus faecium]EGP4756721.1 CoA-binding protein [Enterococcus faecium]EGP5070386.1 CoA-binding protein [Enterococcus faecium]EGP5098298.1 CoA-binding protein [Enterococcus faecium]EGP5163596.1 CoA-binding protein [Enterococcus faecium]EGP5286142.1 CoA-binding protein [Enterococcus faecium]
MSIKNPTQETIFNYLKEAKNIAIVGFSNKPERTSYMVAQVLQDNGYKIIPVNPLLAGEEILGEKVYANLTEIDDSIDIVDVFRRSEFLPEVAADFLKTDAKVFWAQLGIENEEADEMLRKAGRTDVVMDRCIKIELGKLKENQK